MAIFSFLVVVLKIHVMDFVFLDAEGEPPVPRHVQAPCAFPVARQLMRFKALWPKLLISIDKV
jgi:hypothetical protein